jgi:hypothetical protein
MEIQHIASTIRFHFLRCLQIRRSSEGFATVFILLKDQLQPISVHQANRKSMVTSNSHEVCGYLKVEGKIVPVDN